MAIVHYAPRLGCNVAVASLISSSSRKSPLRQRTGDGRARDPLPDSWRAVISLDDLLDGLSNNNVLNSVPASGPQCGFTAGTLAAGFSTFANRPAHAIVST